MVDANKGSLRFPGRSGFVAAFNGSRDGYHVPAALHEAGALTGLVTDFYTPDTIARLPGRFGLPQRHNDILPSRLVTWSFGALARQVSRHIGGKADVDWVGVDRSIGRKARTLAVRTDSIPFSYSHYAHWAFQDLNDRPRVMFQFHPHQRYTYKLLAEDYRRFPEVRWSFENEEDSRPAERQSPERLDEWRLATDIICASHFTASSLIAQGASPEQISVVPYGASFSLPPPQHRRGDRCKFLFVGQGVQRKGLHHLIRAWLIAKLQEAELHLVCYRIDPGIAAMASADNIYIHGYMPRSALSAFYGQTDVFVMPSLVEGFGLAYLEALSHGNFVIGTRNTGLPDLELGEQNADVIEAGKVDQLATSLVAAHKLWLTNDLDRASQWSGARAATWERFRHRLVDVLRLRNLC